MDKKPLSQQMWDWNTMDGHIRPDEWKVQEWSRETAKMESRIAELENPWIKVSEEGLPDYGVPVWGAAAGQGPIMVAVDDAIEGWLWGSVYSHYFTTSGVWECEFEADDDYSWITHYQYLPLPPPPHEGDK